MIRAAVFGRTEHCCCPQRTAPSSRLQRRRHASSTPFRRFMAGGVQTQLPGCTAKDPSSRWTAVRFGWRHLTLSATPGRGHPCKAWSQTLCSALSCLRMADTSRRCCGCLHPPPSERGGAAARLCEQSIAPGKLSSCQSTR
jgi:hypothetical protein